MHIKEFTNSKDVDALPVEKGNSAILEKKNKNNKENGDIGEKAFT
jgi:hypothetical protein